MAYHGLQPRATTAIHVRIKRFDETYFILCDEYETVESLKGRFLSVLERLKFSLPKQEEPLTIDDIRFCIKNRVSRLADPFRFWTKRARATTSKFSTTPSCTCFSASLAPRTSSTSWTRWQIRFSRTTTRLRRRRRPSLMTIDGLNHNILSKVLNPGSRSGCLLCLDLL